VLKKIEDSIPRSADFRVYKTENLCFAEGWFGPKTSCLESRNLGRLLNVILIYTLRGVFGGSGTSFSTISGNPKRPPKSTLQMTLFLEQVLEGVLVTGLKGRYTPLLRRGV
jgi:hypothetical protein